MKAFKLIEWGQPGAYVDVPKPEPGPTDVLIRMKAAGLCRSDLDMVDSQPGSAPYAVSFDAGYILGHENAGYVEAVGAAVTDLAPGEAVVVHHMRHCGSCEHCTGGGEQYCEAFKRGVLGVTRGCGLDGGLAEFLLAPRAEVISVGSGPGIDPVLYAPLADAAVTAYHAVRSAAARLTPGTTAALVGIGGLGAYGVQFAKLLTPARVLAVDTAAGRLELAREALGADEAVLFEGDGAAAAEKILELTGGRGADVVIDFVGAAGTLKLAARVSRPRGRVVLVGMQGGTLEVGWGLLAPGCEFAISVGSTRQDLREVCALAKSGKLRVDVETFPFSDIQKAYDALRAGTLTGRAVVVFP